MKLYLNLLAVAFLASNFVVSVKSALFVTAPKLTTTCHGGQPCTVQWQDDGIRPLLPTIGACTVGLYTNKQELIQPIGLVDVSQVHSLTFTPNPQAGPNSRAYYIGFTSVNLLVNDSIPYTAFSPFFGIDGMSGSFDSPLPFPSATPTIPVPSSLTSPTPSQNATSVTKATTSTSTATATSTSTSISKASSSSLDPDPTPMTTLTFPDASTFAPSFAPSSGFSTAVLSTTIPVSSPSSSQTATSGAAVTFSSFKITLPFTSSAILILFFFL